MILLRDLATLLQGRDFVLWCRRFGLSNNPQEAFKHDHDATSLAEIGGLQELEGANLKQHEAYMIDNYVAAVMLEAGIIFHSIFIGLDIGINNDPAVVRPLMIALMFHQVMDCILDAPEVTSHNSEAVGCHND